MISRLAQRGSVPASVVAAPRYAVVSSAGECDEAGGHQRASAQGFSWP
jgi:hypothetical protein